jgi:2-dehydropantoate 2-reductase
VALVARGEHLRAITDRGLTLETPDDAAVLRIPAVEHPQEIDWTGDETVVLAVKTQDTAAALESLSAAAPPEVAVVCAQNGVENERLALRRFEQVYGAAVVLPAAFLEPGVVQAYGTRLTGVLDVGRYPHGIDERARAIAGALAASRFASEPRADVMRLKYAKLVVNLGNAPQAICEPGPARDQLIALATEEGQSVLAAAGIEFEEGWSPWEHVGSGAIAGRPRSGNSTWQSVARGTGAIETAYLNGEIVLLGRLHRVETPVNQALCALAERHVRMHGAPESAPAEPLLPAWTR